MKLTIKDIFQTWFDNYKDEDNSFRDANKVLYDFVEKHPSHTDKDFVVAKFWLIGRTYAAAAERCKKDDKKEFYYYHLAPGIKSKELDDKIKEIKRRYKTLSNDALYKVLELHKYLVGMIKDITGKENISLASKYLHFHLPNLVFIYDSRASSVIGDFVKGKIFSKDLEGKEFDITYAKFAYKAFEIYKELKNINFSSNYGDTLPRVIDNLLLRYEHIKKLNG